MTKLKMVRWERCCLPSWTTRSYRGEGGRSLDGAGEQGVRVASAPGKGSEQSPHFSPMRPISFIFFHPHRGYVY